MEEKEVFHKKTASAEAVLHARSFYHVRQHYCIVCILICQIRKTSVDRTGIEPASSMFDGHDQIQPAPARTTRMQTGL